MIQDIRNYGAIPDATTNCTSAINNALAVGDVMIQNGVFQIESDIIIPSNRTIYIKNAKLILRSGYYTNMFRNADFNNGNTNIQIIGQGHASICGNSAGHVDGYATWGGETDNTYRYCVGVFVNVSGFEISGITFSDNVHWGVWFQGCSGYADGRKSVIKNWVANMYNIVANQDCFDFLFGTHDIDISNCKFNTNDDPFAIASCNKSGNWIRTSATPTGVRGVGDIYNLSFTNLFMKKSQYHAFVVLTGDGNKIHDITFNGYRALQCQYFCYFGLTGYYDVAPTVNDCYNFSLNNVTVEAQTDTGAVVKALESCKQITFTNFVNNTGKADYALTAGKTGLNNYINGVLQ
ncbi:MAG: hypothetical protein ABIP51_24050 [Bacteroidia bacterium]